MKKLAFILLLLLTSCIIVIKKNEPPPPPTTAQTVAHTIEKIFTKSPVSNSTAH